MDFGWSRRKASRSIQQAEQSLAKGDTAGAQKHFQQALKADDTLIVAHFRLAELAEKRQDFPAVIQHIDASLQFARDNPELADQLKSAFDTSGHEGEMYFQPSCQAFSRSVCMRAQAHQAMGKMKEAEAGFKTTLQMTPTCPAALRGLIGCLEAQKRYKDAYTTLMDLMEQTPQDVQIYLELGRLCELAEGLEPAQRFYRQVLRLDPNNTDVLTALGKSALKQERFEEAANLLKRIMDSGQETTDILNSMALAHIGLGKQVSGSKGIDHQWHAVRALRRSLLLDSNQPAIRKILDEIEPDIVTLSLEEDVPDILEHPQRKALPTITGIRESAGECSSVIGEQSDVGFFAGPFTSARESLDTWALIPQSSVHIESGLPAATEELGVPEKAPPEPTIVNLNVGGATPPAVLMKVPHAAPSARVVTGPPRRPKWTRRTADGSGRVIEPPVPPKEVVGFGGESPPHDISAAPAREVWEETTQEYYGKSFVPPTTDKGIVYSEESPDIPRGFLESGPPEIRVPREVLKDVRAESSPSVLIAWQVGHEPMPRLAEITLTSASMPQREQKEHAEDKPAPMIATALRVFPRMSIGIRQLIRSRMGASGPRKALAVIIPATALSALEWRDLIRSSVSPVGRPTIHRDPDRPVWQSVLVDETGMRIGPLTVLPAAEEPAPPQGRFASEAMSLAPESITPESERSEPARPVSPTPFVSRDRLSRPTPRMLERLTGETPLKETLEEPPSGAWPIPRVIYPWSEEAPVRPVEDAGRPTIETIPLPIESPRPAVEESSRPMIEASPLPTIEALPLPLRGYVASEESPQPIVIESFTSGMPTRAAGWVSRPGAVAPPRVVEVEIEAEEGPAEQVDLSDLLAEIQRALEGERPRKPSKQPEAVELIPARRFEEFPLAQVVAAAWPERLEIPLPAIEEIPESRVIPIPPRRLEETPLPRIEEMPLSRMEEMPCAEVEDIPLPKMGEHPSRGLAEIPPHQILVSPKSDFIEQPAPRIEEAWRPEYVAEPVRRVSEFPQPTFEPIPAPQYAPLPKPRIFDGSPITVRETLKRFEERPRPEGTEEIPLRTIVAPRVCYVIPGGEIPVGHSLTECWPVVVERWIDSVMTLPEILTTRIDSPPLPEKMELPSRVEAESGEPRAPVESRKGFLHIGFDRIEEAFEGHQRIEQIRFELEVGHFPPVEMETTPPSGLEELLAQAESGEPRAESREEEAVEEAPVEEEIAEEAPAEEIVVEAPVEEVVVEEAPVEEVAVEAPAEEVVEREAEAFVTPRSGSGLAPEEMESSALEALSEARVTVKAWKAPDGFMERVSDSFARCLDLLGQLQYIGVWAGKYPLNEFENQMRARVKKQDRTIAMDDPGFAHSLMTHYLIGYEITQDPRHLKVAKRAGKTLLKLQNRYGSWCSKYEIKEKTLHRASFPKTAVWVCDNTTCVTLLALMWIGRITGKDEYKQAAKRAADALITCQNPDGSWPMIWVKDEKSQGKIVKKLGYGCLANRCTVGAMQALLFMGRAFGEDRYLDAVKRAGQWLLNVQQGPPTFGWCSHYDENRESRWGRKVEPPAVSIINSVSAIEGLLYYFAVTGDETIRNTTGRCLQWMERSDTGGWSAYVDPDEGTPVFGDNYKVKQGVAPPKHHRAGRHRWGINLDKVWTRTTRLIRGETPLAPTTDDEIRNRTEKLLRSHCAPLTKVLKAQNPLGGWTDGQNNLITTDRQTWELAKFMIRDQALSGQRPLVHARLRDWTDWIDPERDWKCYILPGKT